MPHGNAATHCCVIWHCLSRAQALRVHGYCHLDGVPLRTSEAFALYTHAGFLQAVDGVLTAGEYEGTAVAGARTIEVIKR